MGIFSSKKRTIVGTTVQRVLDDTALPGAVLAGSTKNLFSEKGDQLIEHIFEELASGIGLRGNQMYNYAKSKYVHGVPQSSVVTAESARSAYKQVLDTLSGGPVTLDYYHFGKLNYMHLAWILLQNYYNYNPTTNIIGNISDLHDTDAFLEDMVLVVKDATLSELQKGAFDQWDVPNAGVTPLRPAIAPSLSKSITHIPFVVDSEAAYDYIKVTYLYEVEVTKQIPSTIVATGFIEVKEKKIERGTFNISLEAVDELPDYHHAKYRHNGQLKYRLYAHDTGEHPTVDNAFTIPYNNLGTYFPWVYFRYNKTAGNANKTSNTYKQSKQLCNYLGMDFNDVCETIHENPDIADVEQAMMMMAVPANTENELERRYLFDFFSAMEEVVGSDSYPQEGGIFKNLKLAMTDKGVIIHDKQFKMALNWTKMLRRKITQSGKQGTHTSGFESISIAVNGKDVEDNNIPWVSEEKAHVYRRQISDVLCEEIRVYDLEMTYYIFDQYTTTGDDDDNILLIPVDKAITDTYILPDREILLARSLHYVFNSRQVIKIKWYERGAFKWLLVIIAVAITVFTNGAGIKTLFAAVAAGTLTAQAVIMMIVKLVLKYFLVRLATMVFVKVVGPKVAFIVAIVAALVAGYQAIQAGSIQGAPWAQELLSLSTGLSKQVNITMQEDMLGLQDEFNVFKKEMDEQMKLLDKTQDLLNGHVALAPLVIFGESPDDFYQRTVHSGNIGVVGVEATSQYVEAMLTLPKLNDIAGEFV